MSLRFSSHPPPGICVECDRQQSNPSHRISNLRAVPLGHIADAYANQRNAIQRGACCSSVDYCTVAQIFLAAIAFVQLRGNFITP